MVGRGSRWLVLLHFIAVIKVYTTSIAYTFALTGLFREKLLEKSAED